MAGALCC